MLLASTGPDTADDTETQPGSGSVDDFADVTLSDLLSILGGALAAALLCVCLRLASIGVEAACIGVEAEDAREKLLLGHAANTMRRGRRGPAHEMV